MFYFVIWLESLWIFWWDKIRYQGREQNFKMVLTENESLTLV